MANFIRNVKLVIGPFDEKDRSKDTSGKNEQEAMVFESTGLPEEARITFAVTKKGSLQVPVYNSVILYNLSDNMKTQLNQGYKDIRLSAGYLGNQQNLTLIGAGGLQAAVSRREGAIITTTLHYLDGVQGTTLGLINKSYDKDTQVTTIIKDVVAKMPGVTLGDLEGIDNKVGSKGLVISGGVRDVINRLAKQYAFSWTIVNNVFHARHDFSIETKLTYTIDERQNNVISITPGLPNSFVTFNSVDIVMLLQPNIDPMGTVILSSITNPELSGKWKIKTVKHQGDTHGGNFITTISCFPIDNMTIRKPTIKVAQ